MKKEVFAIVLGSALMAFGFSGWQASVHMETLPYIEPTEYMLNGGASWTLTDRLEITIGVVLLVGGGLKLGLQVKPSASETSKQVP